MQKIPILMAIFLLISLLNLTSICISSDIQVKTYVFSFDGLSIQTIPTMDGMFSVVSLNESQNTNMPGQPLLPCVTEAIALPIGKTVSSISATFHFNSEYNVAYPIVPAQNFVHSGDDNFSFCYNVSDYQKQLEFNNLVQADIQYLRGYPILNVQMRPINYNPSQNKLLYYDEITLTLSFKNEPVSHYYRNLNDDVNYIRTIVSNPGDLYAPLNYQNIYPGGICNQSEKYDYVIITNNALKNAWQPLINHRTNYSHLNCTIVTVEQINGCSDYWNETPTFNDTQAHIREFCKDAYLDWKTDYILLGGDWRDGVPSEQIVPYRLFTDKYEADTYKTMPCDMYYSNLDGNWYYALQGIWGGGVDSGVNDKYSELFVGRITAYNSSMVQNAIDKIIWYDECNDATWLSKSSFWGGNLGWTETGKQYMEELRLGTDTYRTFTGFEEWNANNSFQINTSERLYHADLGSTYKNYWSNAVQNDNFSIVNHLDHSDWNTPFSLPNWQYRINTKPFFGYTQGCLAGRYNVGYAGCEQMMCRYPDRNAFALILNTGYGYDSTGDTDGPSQYLNCYFWDYFFNASANDFGGWQIGKAQAYSKDKMSVLVDGGTDHAWCYTWYSSHLFGDPALSLKIGVLNTSHAWDINGDNHVDIFDVSLLVNNYGTLMAPDSRADINKDGQVDIFDASILVNHFGEDY